MSHDMRRNILLAQHMSYLDVLKSLRKLPIFIERDCYCYLGVKRLSKLWTHTCHGS